MTKKEKYVAAHKAVSNRDTVEGNLEATNFHSLLQAIQLCVGGSDMQLSLIAKQVQAALDDLTFEKVIAEECKKVYDVSKSMGLEIKPEVYKSCFW